ncbi:MAG: hypothetical protein QXU40_03120, partial [Candidatus Pacearchaeota archaeon]
MENKSLELLDHGNINFIISNKVNSGVILQWLNKNKFRYKVADFGTLKFYLYFNWFCRNKKDDHYIVYIDYKVVDDFDLKTIEMFVNALVESGQSLFYTPRPNEFLQVDRVSIFGIRKPKRLNLLSYILRNYILNFNTLRKLYRISKGFIPRTVLDKAKDIVIRRFYNKHNGSNIGSSSADDIGSIDSIIPNSLLFYSSNWMEWRANKQILKRDLIDRVEEFFPSPQGIHVVLANVCNLKCIHCPYHSPRYRDFHGSKYFENKLWMDRTTFEKIAKYAAK